MATKHLLNALIVFIGLFVFIVSAAPSTENGSNTTSTKMDKRQCYYMDGEFEVSTQSFTRTAKYKFWIGSDVYEWKELTVPTSNPKKTCHKSGVICAKSDTQGFWVDVWYANSQQRFGVTTNSYDYTCDTIEGRSYNEEVDSLKSKRAGIVGCWSWTLFKIAGCFGEGWHSK